MSSTPRIIASRTCPKRKSGAYLKKRFFEPTGWQVSSLTSFDSVLTLKNQALWNGAGIASQYHSLPTQLRCYEDVVWDISQLNRFSKRHISYWYLHLWVAFLFHFLRQWTNNDFIPTFDLELADTNDEPYFNNFKATIRELNPLSDPTQSPANFTSEALEIYRSGMEV